MIFAGKNDINKYNVKRSVRVLDKIYRGGCDYSFIYFILKKIIIYVKNN